MSNYFGVTSSNYAHYVASNDLVDLYENNDLRKQLFLTVDLQTLVNGVLTYVPYNFTRKFQDNAGYVAFRLSEMYLIRAEAALENNQPALAMADINTIRARANATLLSNTANLKEDILLERRNDGCISTNCSMVYPSLKFVLPIPQYNINLNSNLQQNESY